MKKKAHLVIPLEILEEVDKVAGKRKKEPVHCRCDSGETGKGAVLGGSYGKSGSME